MLLVLALVRLLLLLLLTLGRDLRPLAPAQNLVAIARCAVFRTPRVHGPAVLISAGNAHELFAFQRLAQLSNPAKGLLLRLMESVSVRIRQRLAHALVIAPAAQLIRAQVLVVEFFRDARIARVAELVTQGACQDLVVAARAVVEGSRKVQHKLA